MNGHEFAASQSQAPVPTAASQLNGGMTATVHVTNEAHTYARERDPEGKGNSFLTDVGRAYFGNPEAQLRLARHMNEIRVDRQSQMQMRGAGDAVVSDFPGLIVPQYLTGQFEAKPNNARPFADAMTHVDLPPEGMTIELATGNTATLPALQSSELVAVTGSQYDVVQVPVAVQTAEVWQLVSRQAVERGRVVESVVVEDMHENLGSLVDSTVLTQATNGLHTIAHRVEYDSASPNGVELYSKILSAAAYVANLVKGKGKPDLVVMNPRRFYWLLGEFADTFPLVASPAGQGLSVGSATNGGYPNLELSLPSGLRVIADYNVPILGLDGDDPPDGGTEDIVYVLSTKQSKLFEAPGRDVLIRAEAPAANQLGVMLVLYEYFGFTHAQLAGSAKVDGTGTIAV